MIGFERLLYFVEESEGEVVVTVGVQSGTLAEEIVVELTTRSDTATGDQVFKPSETYCNDGNMNQVWHAGNNR